MFRIMIAILLAGLVSIPCSAEFRDPTQPAYSPPTATYDAVGSNALVLSAIWISSQSRRATINGVSAQQGQTIVIEQAPPSSPESAPTTNIPTDKKDELLNKTMEYANEGTNRPTQENSVAPLLAAVGGSSNLAPPRKQSATNTITNAQKQANTAPHLALIPGITLPPLSKTAHTPARSSAIKIISIHKNSVTIKQNGELKILQLVQRAYKTQ